MNTTWARWSRDRPVVAAALVALTGAAVGYGGAFFASETLRDALLNASTALILVALLGGVVKLLLENVELSRERRNDQTRFLTALLADLKSVYDRVERVGILIAAHQSAKTYGSEMRDLIDSAVQLRNVERALDQRTSDIDKDRLRELTLKVKSMETYLKSLIDEFTREYKDIADKQRAYEAAFNKRLTEAGEGAYATSPPRNLARDRIDALPMLAEFRTANLDYSRDRLIDRP